MIDVSIFEDRCVGLRRSMVDVKLGCYTCSKNLYYSYISCMRITPRVCTSVLSFNKQKRKFRNRTAHRKRRKVDSRVVETEVKNQMILYKSPGFTFSFRTYFMNLPRNKLIVVVNVVERLVLDGTIPTRILVLVKDLMAFRLKINVAAKPENSKRESTNKNYMNVMFHNKGMDMINFRRILNSKKVMAAVPNYLRGPPPIVSYTYTRTIVGKIFNNRKVVNELNMVVVL